MSSILYHPYEPIFVRTLLTTYSCTPRSSHEGMGEGTGAERPGTFRTLF